MEPISHMNDSDNWVIVCSQSLDHYVNCICGHRVKRITYLYHKPSKAIQYVGKTCVRKYGIEISLTNPILLDVIKANLKKADWDRDACVREHIQSQYTTFMTLALTSDISVNNVVGPFRRLLSDVCDLVSEYGFDLVDVLRDIQREVESLNDATRHQMVDEYSLCDTISEIASEYTDMADEELTDSFEGSVIEEPFEEQPIEEFVKEYLDEECGEEPIEEYVDEEPVDEESVTESLDEESVIEPIEEPVIESLAEECVIECVEDPVEEYIEECGEETIEECGEECVEESIEDPGIEAVPVEESVIEPAEDISIEDPVEEPVVKLVVESIITSLEERTIEESLKEIFVRTVSNTRDIELCSATTHCYCAIKYRIRAAYDGIKDLHMRVEKERKETEELIEKSRQQRMKTREYLERSRKEHPELFT